MHAEQSALQRTIIMIGYKDRYLQAYPQEQHCQRCRYEHRQPENERCLNVDAPLV